MVYMKKISRRSTRIATRAALIASPAISGPDIQATRALVGFDHMESIHSPFFMHTSDHPGLLLISITLDGSNFDDWEAVM